jgi:EAL domain-containing protein (putative c-di-GMP-specific phosphodiesterase class I)/ActR/RegA family two-component response regulator
MAKRLHELRVMLVDDDPAVLDLTGQFLGQVGIVQIEKADNGLSGLHALDARSSPPDIIICDLNMPGMDGVEFIRHIGERRIPSGIILASGEDSRILSTVQSLARYHGLYVLGVMAKPIVPENLASLVRSYDSRRAPEIPREIQAITEEEFVNEIDSRLAAYFQPKVRLSDSRVYGVEALARWNHPTRGVLGPAAFVPLAEQTGKIGMLTEGILRLAVAFGGEWHKSGLDLSISVNFAVDDLNRVDLPEYVVGCTANAGLHTSRLILEVTESQIMTNLKASTETLSRLRLKGVGLSIDDFGTGYSSMEQLKRVPFTEIKVDRSFVSGAVNDSTARAILESTISLGKSLKLSVVAEGAETREDWELLAKLGCDLVQGYYVAKPMPGDEIPGWVRGWNAKQNF